LILLSVFLLAQTLREKETGQGVEKIASQGLIRIGATLASLVGFALVLERLGFLLSTFLLMVLLLRAIEAPKWSKVFVVALSTALIAYFLFAWLLGIPLPAGILGI
jgi:putative tricarboxylic transport membrane protein